ncbi:restriction endonuclease subunit S [Arthrobacter sp. YAF34]|uniref:restriction endonuclease subunit S n=1 Tax=Arthrobacter sp. YAF34 TaxID=3233083 RepID=UPI003F906D9D
MSGFASVPLSEVATVRSGYAFKSSDWKTSGVPVIKIANIHPGTIDLAGCAYVNGSVADAARAYKARKGDPLIAMSGASVGEIGRVRFSESALVNQRVGIFRVHDHTLLDADFLFHFLQLPETIDFFVASAYGSAQPNISPSLILSVEIPLPTLGEQRAIAEVLGALDDKIAANTNMATTAEKLATTEFHRLVQEVPFSDQTFGELAKVSGGGTPSTAVPEFWNGDVRWATPTDVTGLQGPYLTDTSRRISEAGLNACASELYSAGAIFMTSRATIGAFALPQAPMAVNQGFIVVQPHDPDVRFWFFHEMQSRVDEFISLANGATFLELSRGNFKKFKVRLAEPHVMKEFVALAEPLHMAAANALSENTKLANTRDVLLPQLISGKLRVKDAEKVLAAAGV